MIKTTRLHKINTEKENTRMGGKNEKGLYKDFGGEKKNLVKSVKSVVTKRS